jgi:hypothetical protein
MTNTTAATSTVEFVGITDERTTCDKCGKTHLKRVVVLKIDGEFVFYGTDCAAKAMSKGAVSAKKMNSTLQYVHDELARASRWVKSHGVEITIQGMSNRGFTFEVRNGVLCGYFQSFGWVEVK